MLYQEYKNKMQKLVRILEVIRRFRVLIIFVVLSATLLLLGFLITKGMVFDTDLGEESFTYGEEIDFSAKSLFSRVGYEYKYEDSDWTTQPPRNVGEFKVRAYGKNIFGKQRYGKEFSFTVTKKVVELEIKEEAIGYGETPTPKIDGLEFGDAVFCTEYIYGDRTQAATVVTPVLSSVKITNTDGNDVTGAYDIKIKENDAIAFVKRPVTITIDSESTVYDGEALKAESFKITENTLAFDDQLIASEYPSISSVGEIINNPSSVFVITTPDGLDVTSNYDITVVEGVLSVTPRPIIIHTGSQSFVYDDTEKSFASFTVDESTPLIEGHTVSVDFAPEIRYVSAVNNELAVKIYDENGNDVTSNYELEYVYGVIEVTKRDITINTLSKDWTYDGRAHSMTSYTLSEITDLISGHTLEAQEMTTVLDVTDEAVENVVTYVIKHGENDVSENYNIKYSYGSLNVYKRLLEIKSNDETHIYDDTVFTGSGYTITDGSLAEGQIINIEYTAQITDVGTTTSTFNAIITDGEKDVTYNYDLKLASGTLTVVERPILISANSKSWVYDGMAHKNEEYTLLSELGVVEGHTVVYIKSGTITNVSESPVKNEIEIEIYKGEENKTSNYDISYGEAGYLNIEKRAITVTADSIKEIYNGKDISISTYTVSAPGVAPNQKEEVVISGVRRSWGETENVIDSVVIRTLSGDDVTENYEITYVNGLIKIEKRPIIFASSSWEDFYDGLSHVCHEVNVVIEDGTYGIADGEKAEFYFENSITDYLDGGIANPFSAEISDSIGVPTTDNYDIEYRFGVLNIKKRPISLLSGSSEEFYNGYELTNHSPLQIGGMGLAANEEIEVLFDGTITDYIEGGVDNTYTAKIWNGSKEATANYEVTYEYGKLVIKKRPIVVTTQDATKVYDATELYEPTPSISSEGMELVLDHYLSIVSSTSIINAESKTNETVVVILDGEKNDKTYNYEITYSYGTLEITKRPIEIHSKDQSHIYDAELFIGSEYVIVSEDVANGQILTVTFTGGITEVSESGAENSFEITITQDGESVISNYEPKLVFGTLTINKRVIEIAGVGKEWIYDGLVHKNEEFELLSELDIVAKHTVVFVESPSIKNVADSPMPNNIRIAIYENDQNKTPNYDIVYRTPGDLVIIKRDITITADSLTEFYNGEYWSINTYVISELGLAPNQREEVVIEGSRKNWGETVNEIKSVTIYDENGEEVTENYNLTAVNGLITVNKRPITLESASEEKTYDGTVLYNHSVEISKEYGMGLAGTQTIAHSFPQSSSITDYVLGGVENYFTSSIWDGDEETTENYDITYVYGTLIINKRLISFESESEAKIYDGTPLENHSAKPNEKTDDTGLVNGQTVKYSFDASITDYQKGGIENAFTVTIWSGDYETTNNYEISYSYGKLEIYKRNITIATQNASKVYDGWELYLPDAEITDDGMSLVLDHYLSYVSTTSIINAESRVNETVVIIMDGAGIDKTHNYDITYSYGTLEITKRAIKVTTNSAEKMYDGKALTNDGYTYNLPSQDEPNVGLAYGKNGQRLVVRVSGAVVLVDEVQNIISEIKIYDGEENVTANYEIEKIYGNLKVTPRPITVTAPNCEKVYDGEPLLGRGDAIVGGEGLAQGDKLYATYKGSQTVPGVSAVSIDSVTIRNASGMDATHCYSYGDSDLIDGTLTVTERRITVIANSDSKIYDATPLTNGGYTVGADGLAIGQRIDSIDIVGTITDVGTAKNVASNAKIVSASGEDVTKYYIITYLDGDLTVTKRKITVITGSAEKVYDGLPLTKNEGSVDESDGDGIVLGQTYELTATGYGIDVGEYTNTYTLSIYDASGRDVTHNYEVANEMLGMLVIKPIKLHFTTGSGEMIYTGNALTNPDFSLTSGKIISMHNAEFYTTGAQVNVGSSENSLFVRIYDRISGDDGVMSNYEITVDCGELTVTPRKLTITTGSAEKMYDGTPLTNSECSYCLTWQTDTRFSLRQSAL